MLAFNSIHNPAYLRWSTFDVSKQARFILRAHILKMTVGRYSIYGEVGPMNINNHVITLIIYIMPLPHTGKDLTPLSRFLTTSLTPFLSPIPMLIKCLVTKTKKPIPEKGQSSNANPDLGQAHNTQRVLPSGDRWKLL